MKNYNVIIQPIAQKDMQNIGDYIAHTLYNPDAAIKLIDEFVEQINRIANFPKSGKPLEYDLPLEYEYLQAFVEKYIIFYTVDEETATATVMRILYGGSNYIAKLLSNTQLQ